MIFPLNTVKILGISVSCAKRENVLHLPLKWASETNKRTILYVNAHCMNLAANDLAYREALNRADLVYSDGIGVVWAAKYLGGCTLEKVTGRDWIHDFCALSEKNDLRLYILAGSPGIAQTARQNITKRYPRLQIVGVHPGFLDEKKCQAYSLRSTTPTHMHSWWGWARLNKKSGWPVTAAKSKRRFVGL